ncbi:MAG TPA: tetratricopeptide repeat protein [Verrucomicrobiae bacterium]|jgi:tetratricopeptide (TPR) repeat protein|nr:tetratricopeptide repeat protein [Verrucomicrobiae bacterium]
MNLSKKQLWICLLLAAGTAILFWPVTGDGFIGFDDNQYLVQNWHLQSGLTWSAIEWAFRSGYASNWHPLTWISHLLDVQFCGLNPAGHHLTSLILHSLNAALLFILLNQMTGARWRSALVAALFAWHPLHVESVAWAAERKDVLCAFFWILTMLAYTQYTRKRRSAEGIQKHSRAGRPSYLLALVFFACALMSKPMAVTLPFVLLLADFWPLKRFLSFGMPNSIPPESSEPAAGRTENLGVLILEKLPFFALVIASSIITFEVQQAGGAVDSLAFASFSFRVENAFLAYAGYIWKTIWPAHLAVLYPFSQPLPLASVLAAAVVIVFVSAFTFWCARRRPYLFCGWFWFVGTLVPVIGIIKVGGQSMADRYTYIPSIGLFIAIVWAAAEVASKIPRARNIFTRAAVLVLAALFVLTRHQLTYWRNGETLFKHTIDVTHNNYLAYSALGTSYDDDGHTNEAIYYCGEAVRLNPDYPEGQYNLGTLLLAAGKTEEAIQHFEVALKDNPRFANAENNLGKAYQTLGKLDEAAAHLTAATRLNPNDPGVFYNLGTVLLAQSKLDQAATQFSHAIELMPDNADAQGNLAVTLMRLGRPAEGIIHFAEKVRLKPNDLDARLNYGLALLEQDKPVEAAAQFTEALRIQPESALAHYRLGLALAAQRKSQDAIAQCREALRLQPDFPDAREALKLWGGTN